MHMQVVCQRFKDLQLVSIVKHLNKTMRLEVQEVHLVDSEQSRMINEVHGCPCPTI